MLACGHKASAMPGASFWRMARVASGVTSRSVRPVPPVVRMRSKESLRSPRRYLTGAEFVARALVAESDLSRRRKT
jgi:hypothetical protein